MWQEIFAQAAENGIWAILFCFLLIYQLKDSRRRENKYTATIDALSKHLQLIKEVKGDTECILASAKSKRIKSAKEEIKDYEDCNKACAAG